MIHLINLIKIISCIILNQPIKMTLKVIFNVVSYYFLYLIIFHIFLLQCKSYIISLFFDKFHINKFNFDKK